MTTAFKKIVNRFNTTIKAASSINNTDDPVVFNITSATGIPAVPFYFTVEKSNDNSIFERMVATNVSGDQITATRAQDGSTKQTFSAGDLVQIRVIAAHLDDITVAINAVESGKADVGQIMYIGSTAVPINQGSSTLNLAGIGTFDCGAITSSGVSTFNSFLQPLISEVNNTQRKITCSLTTAEGDMGVAGTYIVSIGYADTGAPYACRYGTYTLNLCKYQSGTWQAKWTLLGTLSAYNPTIACVETSNTSTQLTLTIGVTPVAGHTVGNYSVLKVGGNTGTLNPVWAIANA